MICMGRRFPGVSLFRTFAISAIILLQLWQQLKFIYAMGKSILIRTKHSRNEQPMA